MNGKVLSFYLNHKMFGLDISLVKEISRRVEYSHVPDSDPTIVGLMNLRGQVVSLFDLSQILGISSVKHELSKTEKPSSRNMACIILKAQGNGSNQVGFLIDESGDVLDIQHDWCEKTPANVEEIRSEYISEVVKLHEKLLLILDAERVFDR
ncbi:chemotaxis protein CheW [Anoxynatronum buryatiense]|uniref:Purine-binding chemotaxis protein CheW n=1 Tax=Anoxynatronum buryatiense TaxID=489973 RepID=A0AA45WUV1_9CLOT|nr:chemotaxis protein CheW [Anoxynatronum buryatiense]SMP48032.1 purine-binding chemotaxis protein CheW [Anoxynatronum buryatiense]